MSIQNPTLAPTPDTAPPEDFEYTSDNPPAKVLVDGRDIPVINRGIRTEIRKDGPLSINTISTVYFAYDWYDQNDNLITYGDTITPLAPQRREDDGGYDIAEIKILDPQIDEYITVHKGIVMGVGGGGDGEVEWRLNVGDIGQLFSSIPMGESYDTDSTYFDVVRDAINTINGSIGGLFNEPIELLASGDNVGDQAVDESIIDDFVFPVLLGEGRLIQGQQIADLLPGFAGEKEFDEEATSVQDVIDWLHSHLDGYFYIAPTEDSVALVYEEDPTSTEFYATHIPEVGGIPQNRRVTVRKNNALEEIQPINELTVRGEGTTITGDSPYPVVRLRHTPLYEMAGETSLTPGETLTPDIIDLEDAERYAKNTLKELIDDDAGDGEITMEPKPQLRPFNRVTAKPACAPTVEVDFDPKTYEVQEVVHEIAARHDQVSNQPLYMTRCKVSIPVRKDDIEIVTKEYKSWDAAFDPSDIISISPPDFDFPFVDS